MITPRTRALVSLGASLALGACAHAPRAAVADRATPERAPTFAFVNEARVPVRVYLVGEGREWMLGRVESGMRAELRVPDASLGEGTGFVRLAVIADAPATQQVARDPRATFAIAQPAATLLAQRWTFTQGQLAAPQLFGGLVPRVRR